MTQKQLAVWLTMAGTLPFLLVVFLLWVDFQPLFLPAGLRLIVHSYAVVIVSFLCGLQWGILLTRQSTLHIYLFSSLLVLAMWLSLAAVGSMVGLVITLAGFLLLWILDFRIHVRQLMPAWFFGLRTLATLVVMACLVAIILF